MIMHEVLRIVGLAIILCIQNVEANCEPGDIIEKLKDGPCSEENKCSDAYHCVQGSCCPRKHEGIPGCEYGRDPETTGNMEVKKCDADHPCGSGFGCRNTTCCPVTYRILTGPCRNGATVEMKDGAPRKCTKAIKCPIGEYICSDGFCCPTKVNSNICPKQGIPAMDENQRPIDCDSDNPCNMTMYSCFNGTCCPTAVYKEKCPKNGVPMFKDNGRPVMCNMSKPCPGTTYKCQPSGYCCPTTVFKDYCPNKGIPDVEEDGHARRCNDTYTCNNKTHTCSKGYCCPNRVFSGACNNGGEPEMKYNKSRSCVEGKEDSQCEKGFSCREGVCCPDKVFLGYCPKGGNVKTREDGSAYECKPGDPCGFGAFSCQGGYCCPMKVIFEGPCPNGGKVETMFDKPRMCNKTSPCGGEYKCQNNHCCPSPGQEKVCPDDGLPEKLHGSDRRCGALNPCGVGYMCNMGFCCPKKINAQDLCLGNGVPDIEDDKASMCKRDKDCRGDAFQCINYRCCPKMFMAMGSCKSGGNPLRTENGKVMTCNGDPKECGPAYRCEVSMERDKKVMHCCPRMVNPNLNLTDICGANIGPLMSKNGSSALLCENSTDCPDQFYCNKNKMNITEQVCCPNAVRTKPGKCPVVDWGQMTPCNDSCRTDKDCNFNKICCASNCGLKCIKPMSQVKEGFCESVPKKIPGMVGKCLDQCSDDSHCEGDKKCCNNGCGYFCVHGKNAMYVDSPSQCGEKYMVEEKEIIVGANSKTSTKLPKNCQVTLTSGQRGGENRIQITVEATKIKDCKVVLSIYDGTGSNGDPILRVNCSTKLPKMISSKGEMVTVLLEQPPKVGDFDFVLRVMSYTVEKPGECPKVPPGQQGLCVQKCKSDKDCDDDAKCCSNGCGHVCQKPKRDCEEAFEAIKTKLQKQGDKCAVVFIPRCDKFGQYSKTQCKDNTGECWCEVGKKRLNNTRIRGNPDCSRATKPGLCPILRKSLKGKMECVEKCKTDDDCKDEMKSKCCFHGCGTMCVATRNDTDDEDNTVCPEKKPEKCCDFYLCAYATCPAYPDATCRVNPCGKCTVHFFDNFDNEVNCTVGLSDCQLMAMKANQGKEDMGYSNRVKHFLDMVNQEGKREMKEITMNYTTQSDMEDEEPKQEEICAMPAVVGPCKAAILRYYYDPKTKKCEKFSYGGCQGNKNNFESMKHCEKFCVEGKIRCTKPAFVGKCRASIPAWFYNATSGKCETFYYGGCDADEDDNIFVTEQTCTQTCGQKSACEKKKCPADTKCIPKDADNADCISTKKIPNLGHYIPKCLANGSFSPVQCDQKSHVCWCVDDNGKPVPESLSIGEKPKCSGRKNNPSSIPACENKAKFKVCHDSCHHSTCGDREDVVCQADPCDDCKVHFLDVDGKRVKCDIDMCKTKPPTVTRKPKFGCVNSIEMWYHDSQSKSCKSFKYSKICHGDNMYFRSKEECQDKCLASACDGKKLIRGCDDTCAGKVCPNLATTAHCVVDKCTCSGNFRDRFDNSIVNCRKLPTTCQRFRAEEIERNNRIKATSSSSTKESEVPQCRDTGLFSPIQCDDQYCWCVGPIGKKKSNSKQPVSQRDSMECADDKVQEVIVKMRSKGDYDTVVKGKEAAFKKDCRQKIKELNSEAEMALKDCMAERGSIVIVLVFEANDEVPDPLSAAVVINNTVNEGQFSLEFSGTKLVVEVDGVSLEVMTSAQLEDKDKKPVPKDDDYDGNKTAVIVVAVLASVAAVILIGIAVVLIRRKRAKDSIQFSSLEDNKKGRSNAMYFNNAALET